MCIFAKRSVYHGFHKNIALKACHLFSPPVSFQELFDGRVITLPAGTVIVVVVIVYLHDSSVF